MTRHLVAITVAIKAAYDAADNADERQQLLLLVERVNSMIARAGRAESKRMEGVL